VRLNVDRLRRMRRELPLVGTPHEKVTTSGDEGPEPWLLEALGTLSPRQRTAVALRFVEDPDGVAVDPAGSSGSVLLTRPDGSTHRFDEISVDCGSGSTGRRTVSAQSPRRLGGDRLLQPWFYLEANLGELEVGRTYELPLSGDSDRLPLIAFVADTAAEGGRSNEVSSAQPGAGGTMRVLEASCGRTPTLRFQLDATLGSEVSRGPLDVAGSSE
jgi:hypothetical protein